MDCICLEGKENEILSLQMVCKVQQLENHSRNAPLVPWKRVVLSGLEEQIIPKVLGTG